MFDNIGKKIKGLAKTICIIQMILFVIIGVVLMSSGVSDSDDEYYGYYGHPGYGYAEEQSTSSEGGEIAGLLVIIIGPLAAWASSFILYGFGELVDKTCEIAENAHPLELDNNSDLT